MMNNITKLLDRLNLSLFRSNGDRPGYAQQPDHAGSSQQDDATAASTNLLVNTAETSQKPARLPLAGDAFNCASNGTVRTSNFRPPLPSPSSSTPSIWPDPPTTAPISSSSGTFTPSHSPFAPPTSIQLESSQGAPLGSTTTTTNSSSNTATPISHFHYPPVAYHNPPPRPSCHHQSLAASYSQPMMPVAGSSTSSSNASTPLGGLPSDGHKNSYSAVQTPDSPVGSFRRQSSFTVAQRTSANSLHLDLKSRTNSASCSNELSLSPRPRPRNLGLSNSQDNMFRNSSQHPPQSSSHHRSRPSAFMPHVNSHSHHHHSQQQQQQQQQSQASSGVPPSPLSHHGYYPGRLNETFKKNNETLTINGVKYENVQETDFIKISDLGSGSFGQVDKMFHKNSKTELAVKKMRRSGSVDDNRHIMNDLELLTKCLNYPHIVQCHGYFIMETEVWIFMELMTTCFDRLLKKLKDPIPENIIGKIAVTTVSTLDYLKTKHEVIHRDVKPSNILINRDGIIKLCDFGISGHLIESIAYTRSVGCAAYMAPERIEPPAGGAYDIRSDVWSLGITLVEIATGEFPYKGCNTEFAILSQIVNEEPPTKLIRESGRFSSGFCDFIAACLTKDYTKRPKYNVLLETPFLRRFREADVDVGDWFRSIDF